LLDNAVKFTRPGDTIGVTGGIDRQSWMVEVADSGPGLLSTSTHPAAGSGLGLATVRAVVESWQGTVTLRDREGGGTIATLRFPVAA
jgi:signal transduction histidine kinase